MTQCLETKKSNCKNCYKCIRHCPVKSLKFADGQAYIIHEECVLCGECYVICPQNAKQVRSDGEKLLQFIREKKQVYVSLAPSYAAWYEDFTLSDISAALYKLGVEGVFETALGAAIVKTEYENIIDKHEKSLLISSCCHTVNTLIERHYKNAIPYLADVVTPMQAHGSDIKKAHKDCKVVFIGPCISKKDEADTCSKSIDIALTFEELDELLAEQGIEITAEKPDQNRHRTNVFPTSGGIIKSMHKNPDFNYITIDGMENCINALKNIDSGKLNNCFIEMSACSGSCIGGPVMKRKERNPIVDAVQISNRFGEDDYNFTPLDKKIVRRYFAPDGHIKPHPGDLAVEEILKKMGKYSPEQELNCGSCGYNTCRDKAMAVLMGKADFTMCLPYLKEKAESFSDAIVHNTPNGIMVLNEQLDVQVMNSSAKRILNLPESADIISNPVVRILDPVDYVLALSGEKDVYDKRKYLAQYKKYIEETIIYNKEYHIIIVIMKDISQEEEIKHLKESQNKAAVEITDKVVEKQMRVVQEIALLLGETTAETKIALTKLKDTLSHE